MSEKKAIRVAYGEALAELGEVNDKIVALDADLSHSTMTYKFADKFPERFFNAGIAEANMVDMAVGLASMGYIPFVSTFAIFGTGRAYDQVRNGCAYGGFNVKFAMSHAGVTLGEDGGTHQAIEDIALMRVIPDMTVIVPCDANEAKRAVKAMTEMQGPAYLRMARMPSPVLDMNMPFEIGKANVLREGTDAVIFACGIMVEAALQAADTLQAEGIHAAVVNIHTIKPLDEETILTYAKKCKKVVTAEEHSVIGGLGDAVASALLGNGDFKFKKIGVQDRFGQSGKPFDLLAEYNLTPADIVKAVKSL
ncbi:MAG: transketolase C-terminal domain-containing protein [Lachnospiraceae bacterium]|nr:transketolase C-terminal domain-containing protein [Lachnospiraceae bacterium]